MASPLPPVLLLLSLLLLLLPVSAAGATADELAIVDGGEAVEL